MSNKHFQYYSKISYKIFCFLHVTVQQLALQVFIHEIPSSKIGVHAFIKIKFLPHPCSSTVIIILQLNTVQSMHFRKCHSICQITISIKPLFSFPSCFIHSFILFCSQDLHLAMPPQEIEHVNLIISYIK
jgi:hypothetical protein